MSTTVAKQVRITETRAKHLAQLATMCGTTEDLLIEEGLDLLFTKRAQTMKDNDLDEEDHQLVAELEAESGAVQHATRPVFNIDRNEIVSLIGTPMDPRRLRRSEE